MRRNKPTVQQIADHMGLSKFSVSRALSGKSGVSEATRARIVQAAATMSGSPAKGRQVLFVTQEGDGVSPELWLTMLHGAEREAARCGITLIPREARHLKDFTALDPAVCGLVLATASPNALAEAACRVGLPAVSAGYVSPMLPIDQVVTADWEAGVLVARYLTGLGHRCIGFVRGESALNGRRERLRGLRDGIADSSVASGGVANPGADVHEITYAEPSGFPDALRALLRTGVVPTALFCAHDGLAVTTISELARKGVRVPDDVSVIGFFDFAAATQIVPPLTTIRVPQEQMGVTLVRCLLQRLDRQAERMPPNRIAVVAELLERESVTHAVESDWAARFLDDTRGRPSRTSTPRDSQVADERRADPATLADP